MNQIEVFQETWNIIQNNPRMKELTERAVIQTRVIGEGFFAGRSTGNAITHLEVEETLTLIAAYRLADAGYRTTILDFANPLEPGGGVLRGANAQEEYLCRASNLYPCLIGRQAEHYYQTHKEMLKNNIRVGEFLSSDSLIYSPGVTFIREDMESETDVNRQFTQEYTDCWREMDVITCAVPIFFDLHSTLSTDDLYRLLCRRIRNIFEVAMEYGTEAIVLGAFGCGAFHNPPFIVASAFKTVLGEARYQAAFYKVVFAIKGGVDNENLRAFQSVFRCGLRSLRSCEPPVYNFVSILGDSISTFEGFHAPGYAVYYDAPTQRINGITSIKETWWDQVIRSLNMNLCINDSYSGSRVTGGAFPSAACDERLDRLGSPCCMPDVILIYVGFNDFGTGAPVRKRGILSHLKPDMAVFRDAYRYLLNSLQRRYPHAIIICGTLMRTMIHGREDWVFPEAFYGVELERYNNEIRSAAKACHCSLADLAALNLRYETLDGSHPTFSGHKIIADAWLYCLQELGVLSD